MLKVCVNILVSFIIALSPMCIASAQTTEHELKAACIYHFARFVDWKAIDSAEGDASLIIEIVGEDPFGGLIDEAMQGKAVQGRPIMIRRSIAVDSSESRHVLFICDSEASNLDSILATVGDQPVLTVGEHEGFAVNGGMIGFVREGNLIKFELNTAAVARSGLYVSSRLLKVARVVTEGSRAERE